MSFDRLIERIIELKNPTVVGLDPSWNTFPNTFRDAILTMTAGQ